MSGSYFHKNNYFGFLEIRISQGTLSDRSKLEKSVTIQKFRSFFTTAYN